MGALQYIGIPGYKAIIFMKTHSDAQLELVPRSREWFEGTGANWNGQDMKWAFPNGSLIFFGYLNNPGDEYRYKGVEFQYIAFDELTEFREKQYTYMFSRLRKTVAMGENIPLRVRSATNPGGPGHDWVKHRFMVEPRNRVFIPAKISDNPHLDQESYIENLKELSEIERQRLLDGDWDAADDGLLSYADLLAISTDCVWPGGMMPPSAHPELYIGVDQGRTRDLSVIWTWERVGDVLICRECFVMDRYEPREQAAEIKRRINRYVVRCGIDEGAQGWDLAHDLERQYPGIVEPVSLGSVRQGQMATMFHRAVKDQRVRIPDDDDIRHDFRLVRRPNVSGEKAKLATDRDKSGHADRFWAAAIGLWMASDAPVIPMIGVPMARTSSLAGRG